METKNSLTNDNIRDLLNNSANKTNTNLIFFFSFGLYVYISVLNTSDIALLLPRHSFKMPFIDFELGLLHFYTLAPLLLLLLHFNLLFNHFKNIEKLDKYKNKIDLTTINPSLYGFSFIKGGNYQGFMINIMLYMLLYILPLIVFITMYIRFADYHHQFITPLHLFIIIIDIGFIFSSIFLTSKHTYLPTGKLHYLKIGFFIILFTLTGYTMVKYYKDYFYPVASMPYNASYSKNIKKSYEGYLCRIIRSISNDDECYPRLIVTEEEMAKISKSALYIPRYLTMKNTNKENIEHDLIIKHGTRIDLSKRNLRYAILKGNILTRANLRSTQLQAANLIDAHMQAVDLENADLENAIMMYTKLEYAYLGGTNLQGANLASAHMQNIKTGNPYTFSNFSNAKFTVTTLNNVNLKRANLTGTNFNNVNLTGSSFVRATITSSQFINANLTNTNFSEATFTLSQCKQLPGMPILNNKEKCGAPNFRGSKMLDANLNILMKTH